MESVFYKNEDRVVNVGGGGGSMQHDRGVLSCRIDDKIEALLVCTIQEREAPKKDFDDHYKQQGRAVVNHRLLQGMSQAAARWRRRGRYISLRN